MCVCLDSTAHSSPPAYLHVLWVFRCPGPAGLLQVLLEGGGDVRIKAVVIQVTKVVQAAAQAAALTAAVEEHGLTVVGHLGGGRQGRGHL